MNRRIVSIIIVIVVAALLALGAYQTFKSGQRKNTPAASPTPSPTPKPLTLLDYLDSDDAQVSFTTIGRVIDKEDHNTLTITISKNRRTVQSFNGYTIDPVVDQAFGNNQPAFEDFMRALQNAGFTSTKTSPKAASTETGLCPNGNRFLYEVVTAGTEAQRFWSTSCGDPTTFAGNSGLIRQLFQNQIPNYGRVTSGIRL